MGLLEFQVKWEHTYRMLLNELGERNAAVQEAIAAWMKAGLEPARVLLFI